MAANSAPNVRTHKSDTVWLEPASVADLAAFARMEQQDDTSAFILPYSLAEHRARFVETAVVYLRIMHGEQLCGFFLLVLEDDLRSVEFRRVVVAEAARGIGSQAIALLLEYCHQVLKRRRIWLDVFEENARAQHIYEKLGFQLFDRKRGDTGTLLFYQMDLQER